MKWLTHLAIPLALALVIVGAAGGGYAFGHAHPRTIFHTRTITRTIVRTTEHTAPTKVITHDVTIAGGGYPIPADDPYWNCLGAVVNMWATGAAFPGYPAIPACAGLDTPN